MGYSRNNQYSILNNQYLNEHAKRLLFALKENLTKFESQFGTVKVNEMGPILPMNFGGPTGEA